MSMLIINCTLFLDRRFIHHLRRSFHVSPHILCRRYRSCRSQHCPGRGRFRCRRIGSACLQCRTDQLRRDRPICPQRYRRGLQSPKSRALHHRKRTAATFTEDSQEDRNLPQPHPSIDLGTFPKFEKPRIHLCSIPSSFHCLRFFQPMQQTRARAPWDTVPYHRQQLVLAALPHLISAQLAFHWNSLHIQCSLPPNAIL